MTGWRSETSGDLARIISAGVAGVVAPIVIGIVLVVVSWLMS
jgi:tetrahydromethanopterin S-methyltransferase subunit F